MCVCVCVDVWMYTCGCEAENQTYVQNKHIVDAVFRPDKAVDCKAPGDKQRSPKCSKPTHLRKQQQQQQEGKKRTHESRAMVGLIWVVYCGVPVRMDGVPITLTHIIETHGDDQHHQQNRSQCKSETEAGPVVLFQLIAGDEEFCSLGDVAMQHADRKSHLNSIDGLCEEVRGLEKLLVLQHHGGPVTPKRQESAEFALIGRDDLVVLFQDFDKRSAAQFLVVLDVRNKLDRCPREIQQALLILQLRFVDGVAAAVTVGAASGAGCPQTVAIVAVPLRMAADLVLNNKQGVLALLQLYPIVLFDLVELRLQMLLEVIHGCLDLSVFLITQLLLLL